MPYHTNSNIYRSLWASFRDFCITYAYPKITFSNIFSGTLSECQMVWIQIRTGSILSFLIWFKTVCKGYKQKTEFLDIWGKNAHFNEFYWAPTTNLRFLLVDKKIAQILPFSTLPNCNSAIEQVLVLCTGMSFYQKTGRYIEWNVPV